jgi:hypothetical protein
MTATAITRTLTVNIMSFALMILAVIIVTALSPKVANANLVVVPYVAPGKVITKTHDFQVWVTETPIGVEMLVNLGVSAVDEKEFFSRAQLFQQSVKVPGCQQSVGKTIPNLNRLALFIFVCDVGAKPDSKVREPGLDSIKPHLWLHRRLVPAI